MSPVAVRRVVIAVCVCGIAGMIVGSIADNNGMAITFGLVTAVAVLCLIVATAVSRETSVAGDEVEALVHRLVDQGAPEADLRQLVRAARRAR